VFKKKEGGGFFDRLKTGLEKTRKTLASGIEAVIFGERVIDGNLMKSSKPSWSAPTSGRSSLASSSMK